MSTMFFSERQFGNGFARMAPLANPRLASVIIPSYNHEAFVEEALESIYAQDYGDLEVILVDDGSSDGTYESAVRSLAGSTLPFCAVKQGNTGSPVAGMNWGIGASHGNVLSFLASDDIFFKEKISRSFAALDESRTDVVLAQHVLMQDRERVDYSSATDIGEVERWYAKGRLLERIYNVRNGGLQFPYLGLLMRRSLFDRIGFFDPLAFTEDYEMFVRIAFTRVKIGFLRTVVGAHRVGPRPTPRQGRILASQEYVLRKFAPSMWLLNKAIARCWIEQALVRRRVDGWRAAGRLTGGVCRYPPFAGMLLQIIAGWLRRELRGRGRGHGVD